MQDVSYFVLDIQDDIEYIIKNYKKSTTAPPVHVYINWINALNYCFGLML